MITELEELATALHHQAHACYLTVENKKRTHASSVLAMQAELESALAVRNKTELVKSMKELSDTCLSCIRVTGLTGNTPRCITKNLPELEDKIRGLEHSKWQRIDLQGEEKTSDADSKVFKHKPRI